MFDGTSLLAACFCSASNAAHAAFTGLFSLRRLYDATALEDFKRAMTEEVIPEIVRVVEERRMLAAESRLWQLKC
jgi:hypothetical protein